MSKISTSFIVVNYNVTQELRNCLYSIYEIVKGDFEVIVVDNNSPDRDIESFKDLFPYVKFHYLTTNLGFAQANNYAADYALGEYLVFLNPDTILIDDFISPIISFSKEHSLVGACGPVLLNKDKSFQDSTGIELGYIYELSEAFMLIRFLRKIYNIWFYFKINQHDPFEIKWLSAACLLISKKIFYDVGKFNSEFFLNYEDIDLCQRVRELGFRNICFPDLKCIHLDQKSQTKDLTNFVVNRYRGRLVYAKYHYNFIKRIIIRYLHIIGIIVRILISKLFYKGTEYLNRTEGYKISLKLYLNEN
jgi:O-antigen biosynthesis protein